MPVFKCSNEACKAKTEVLSQDDNSTVIKISDNDDGYLMTSYQVFAGIKLIYNDVHIQSYISESVSTGNLIEICHCREGRMECNFHDEFCYISPGDLLIARVGDISRTSYFPLKHYHGISVLIDIDKAPKCLSCLLEDVTVQPRVIAEKFCSEKSYFVARSNPSFEHIFSELYSVPTEIQKGYFKIKVLELLLFLSALNTEQDETQDLIFTKTQVELAKEVSRYLTQHMDDRITLEQLSNYFHMSGTHIRNTFKGVYGVSVYAFIRTQKMESAAYMLEHTDKSILEIAGEHGYDNGSKFASAFRDVKGMAPNEYRNLNCKRKLK